MHIHDVLVVGAGPCGLAIAARLREHTPSATFTDDEHQRYHWIRKHGRKMNIKNYRTGTNSLPTPPSTPEETSFMEQKLVDKADKQIDMLVVDGEGDGWLARWNRLFSSFAIEYLRSPMFFQIDPADRDSLLGYTYEQERQKELQSIAGCVGKEVSKHRMKKKRSKMGRNVSQSGPDIDERDRQDYFTPSRKLFTDHCGDVAVRYQLRDGMVQREGVLDIDFLDPSSDEEEKMFRVVTSKGTHFARVVVLAVGPGNAPSVPSITGLPACAVHEGFSHAMRLKQFPPPHVVAKIQGKVATNMLIVGGGLTGIQLADLAIKRGVKKVWLLMRGGVKVKYFDVDLDWVGKFRNVNQAVFWSADSDEERLEMLLGARGGGSMTPRYRKILDAHVASGKIELCTYTTLQSVSWDSSSKSWTSITSSPSTTFPPIDFLVFATGVQTNVEKIPFLQKIVEKWPIKTVGGLPCVNDDLMWNDDVPLFVTGRLASLKLGPGAPNLVGARIGAERISWNIVDILDRSKGLYGSPEDSDGESDGDARVLEYAGARSNRFNGLGDFCD